jgi:hypothetical protein
MVDATGMRALFVAAGLAVSVGLTGCAGGGGGGSLTTSSLQGCKQWRKEMNQLISRGVTGKIEAANAGRRVSAKSRAQIDRYNSLLAQYLGARCHA